ncbi:hypothetical protein P5P86_18440 [Nocardioides sp. BP30]|uniref:hypothetical protein n=1 Tax=Nocardioides sp. BP30 TaxID=3036374 RepID=UPI002468CBE8|nr:hypothetical protein [Nocardioides sp. BP30]WGL51918.1 hypothetical protein P5P86_18440 [Nocardioides sp. BP30]
MTRDRIGARLLSAWRGRALWRRLSRSHQLDAGAYALLMIEDDAELNELALRHVEDLVHDRRAAGVVVLTDRAEVARSARDGGPHDSHVLGVVELSARQVDDLLALAELYTFSVRLLVVSWRRPYGADLRTAVGVHGVTVEDVLCLCMLMIRSWPAQAALDG